MYIDSTVGQYLEDLASAQPTPGGGSAAALSGAMGAALASMVCRLTLGKEKYADVQGEIEALLQKTEGLRERFQQLSSEDSEAYGRLSACFKMPRATEEERRARTTVMQARLLEAARVPLEVTERAAETVHLCQRIAEIGNTNVLSDIATGSMLASSAGAGAAWMVRANLQMLKDLAGVSLLNERLTKALENISSHTQRVTEIVGSRT